MPPAASRPAAPEWLGSLTPPFPDRYRALLHGMQQAFCVVEVLFDAQDAAVDYRFLEINAAFTEQTTLGNPVGRTMRELEPRHETHWYERLGEVARTGQPAHFEQRAQYTGNRWYEVYALPTGPAGRHQVALLLTDVTARRHTQQRQEFLLALDEALRPLTDAVAVEAAATEAARRLLGADRCYYCAVEGGAAVIRRDAAAAGLPSVAGTYPLASFPLLQAGFAAGRPLVVTDARTSPLLDEKLRELCLGLQVVSFINLPVLKQGQPRGTLCVVQGTPRTWTPLEVELAAETAERTWAAVARAQAEAALRAQEAQLTAVFDVLPAGLALADATGKILRFNAAFHQIWGNPPVPDSTADYAAWRARWVETGAPLAADDWAMARTLRTGEIMPGDLVEIERFDGGHAIILNAAAPIRDEAGAVVGGVVAELDVTAQWQAEQALRRSEARQAFLLRLSDALRPLGEPETIRATAMRRLGQHLGVSRAAYVDAAGEPDTMSVVSAYTQGVAPWGGRISLADFGAALGSDFMQGKTVVIADTQADERFADSRATYAALEIGAAVGVPLYKEGRVVAAMGVHNRAPRAWTPDEVALIEEVAERTWAAVARARAEAALHASEQRLRALMESLPGAAVFVVDRDLRYREARGEALLAAGLTPADLLGRTVAEVLPPAVAAHHLPYYRQALAGQGFAVEHQEFGHAYLSRGVPLRGAGGAAGPVEAVLVVSVDLTERQRTEAALRRSEEQFRLFVTASSDVLYRMDADWQHLLRLDGRGLLANTPVPHAGWLETYVPPADHALVRAAIRAARAERQYFELEHRVLCTDGSVGWLFSRAVPVFDAQGQLTEWFGTATDVTARRQAEAAQRASEAKYHTLFQSIDEGFCVVEVVLDAGGTAVDYRILEVNAIFEQQTGLADAAGRLGSELAPATERYWLDAYGQVVQTGEPVRFENYHADTRRWYEAYFARVDGPGSRQVAVVFADVTARKQANEAEKLHLRLSAQQQQVAAVLEGQEEERRRIAESLHNGLGQLLYATKLQLDLLPPTPEQPARQEAGRLLAESIRQARAISHELSPALLEEFGLQAALQRICQQLSGAGLRWHCHLVLDEAPPLPVALQQAVYRLAQGLAHNVAKHAQAREATLEVEVLPGWVVLRVEDDGQGFDPATVTEGLGTKTLRSRVALLGGVLRIDSAPGQGTQVLVRLPLS